MVLSSHAAVLLCATSASALNQDYGGYFHFKSVSMRMEDPHTFNQYVTPGDGANALGFEKMTADIDLAKHLCDRYPSCMWFNGDGGFPGSIGWWNSDPSHDTYIKNTTGAIVSGSSYYNTHYLHLNEKGANCHCELIAGPWQLPPDQVKQQCDQLAACQGFTVKNDLSSGFLCSFSAYTIPYDTFIKLPAAVDSVNAVAT